MAGASLIHTAAADHRLRTSTVSPSTGIPSGVSDSRPLMAYLISASPSTSISSMACSICASKSSAVNGISVGESAASSFEGISSGWWKIGRWAYEPTSIDPALWRS